MNNNENIIERPKKSKIALTIFIIITFLMLCLILGTSFSNKEDIITLIIFLTAYAIFTLCIYKTQFSKINRKAMAVMKRFNVSQEEVNNYLTSEKFKSMDIYDGKLFSFSKHWIIAEGTYIPKNFIVKIYVEIGNSGIFNINFVLINRLRWMVSVGSDKAQLEKILNKLKKEIPHFSLCNGYFDDNLPGKIKENYERWQKSNGKIEDVINEWNSGFEIK